MNKRSSSDKIIHIHSSTTYTIYSLVYTPNEDSHTNSLKTLKQNRRTFLSRPPFPLCPPQIPHGPTWGRPQATAVTRRRLTAWATARTFYRIKVNYTSSSSPIEYYKAGSHMGEWRYNSRQECTIPKNQVAEATELCTVVPNIFGSSVWNLLYSILLAPRILRWLLDFWKISAPLAAGFLNLAWKEIRSASHHFALLLLLIFLRPDEPQNRSWTLWWRKISAPAENRTPISWTTSGRVGKQSCLVFSTSLRLNVSRRPVILAGSKWFPSIPPSKCRNNTSNQAMTAFPRNLLF
jgi:hypothetical protein